MSASLVGSEMCIRDRPSTSRGRADALAYASCTFWSTLDRHQTQCEETAVSYTHLTLPTICSV
eukprot:3476428-Alexandrium_andersonii.AAC.1